MRRELRVYLWDLRKALAEMEEFTAGKTLDDYRGDRILQLAMEREFITVGEVIYKILQHFPETKSRIEHAQKIANFRHILVHDYHRVVDSEVWHILQNSVPKLRVQVQLWIEELDRAEVLP